MISCHVVLNSVQWSCLSVQISYWNSFKASMAVKQSRIFALSLSESQGGDWSLSQLHLSKGGVHPWISHQLSWDFSIQVFGTWKFGTLKVVLAPSPNYQLCPHQQTILFMRYCTSDCFPTCSLIGCTFPPQSQSPYEATVGRWRCDSWLWTQRPPPPH